MKLDDLQKQWEEDSKVDNTNLAHEATRGPQLSAKYLRYLSNANLLLRKADNDYMELRKAKFVYYRGEMSKDELANRQWRQYLGKTLTKGELDDILKMDSALRKLEDRVEYYNVMKTFLEGVLKSINNRTWDIRAAIDWHKVQNGII